MNKSIRTIEESLEELRNNPRTGSVSIDYNHKYKGYMVNWLAAYLEEKQLDKLYQYHTIVEVSQALHNLVEELKK